MKSPERILDDRDGPQRLSDRFVDDYMIRIQIKWTI